MTQINPTSEVRSGLGKQTGPGPGCRRPSGGVGLRPAPTPGLALVKRRPNPDPSFEELQIGVCSMPGGRNFVPRPPRPRTVGCRCFALCPLRRRRRPRTEGSDPASRCPAVGFWKGSARVGVLYAIQRLNLLRFNNGKAKEIQGMWHMDFKLIWLYMPCKGLKARFGIYKGRTIKALSRKLEYHAIL